MDDIKTIIATLSAEDKKEFSAFIQRQKKKKSRKDLDLFKILQQKKDFKPEEIIARLYPQEPNPVAYHALRKRLMQHLIEFIMLKRVKEDTTAGSSIMGLLSLSRYLFDMQAERLAWQFLRKAEKLAAEHEHYDLLNAVYNLQIEKADSEHADELEQIIQKHAQNKILADEDERAAIANSLINKKLNEFRLEGQNQHTALNFDQIIARVLQTYNLSEAVSKRPRLLYALMSIARSAILVKKDFYSFAPYIISQYEQMEEKYGFSPAHREYKLQLLYMIAHVLYRSRHFERSLHYLDLLNRELNANAAALRLSARLSFYPRYMLLSAANYAFTRRNELSIELLTGMLANKSLTLSHRDSLNALLNLSFYEFQRENYRQANQHLLAIQHSDQWCEKKMGKEWVLRKNLIEAIIQYELHNEDIALNKLRSMERHFGAWLRQSAYKNVQTYIQFVRQLIDDPRSATGEAFFRQVDASFEFAPVEQEDLQAMSFYAWLKAKMVRKKYYEVLMELVAY